LSATANRAQEENMTRTALLLGLLALAPACKQTQSQPPAAAAPGAAVADPAGGTVVATVGGAPITLAEVDKAAGRELFELRERTLDNLVTERVMDAAAKKAGVSADEFVRKQVETRVPQVSEQEAADFFAKNQERMGPQFAGKKFDEVKTTIVQGLTGQKRQEAVAAFIEELKGKAGVKMLLEAPRVQVAATGPSKGPATAKVTIVEFSDFQCPFCSRGKEAIDQVVKAYGDKVRVVFRDFPLSFHENAQKAAEAGQCAHEQGKFWEMHDWMFDNQKTLGVPELKAAARKLGLKGDDFDKCVDSGKFAGAVAENMKAGTQAGVRGTPAFFINGKFLNGAQPFETFKKEIDRALAP
jgi:protein-disulfide isomerase